MRRGPPDYQSTTDPSSGSKPGSTDAVSDLRLELVFVDRDAETRLGQQRPEPCLIGGSGFASRSVRPLSPRS